MCFPLVQPKSNGIGGGAPQKWCQPLMQSLGPPRPGRPLHLADASQGGMPVGWRAGSILAAVPKVGNVGAQRVTGEKPDNQAERSCADRECDFLVCHRGRRPLSPIRHLVSSQGHYCDKWSADTLVISSGWPSLARAATVVQPGSKQIERREIAQARAEAATAATDEKRCTTGSRGSPSVTKTSRDRRSSSGQSSSSTGGCATC